MQKMVDTKVYCQQIACRYSECELQKVQQNKEEAFQDGSFAVKLYQSFVSISLFQYINFL